MYHRLSYISGGVLPLKSLILYIYRPRGTMNQSSISAAVPLPALSILVNIPYEKK
jgi:hypothetical protein